MIYFVLSLHFSCYRCIWNYTLHLRHARLNCLFLLYPLHLQYIENSKHSNVRIGCICSLFYFVMLFPFFFSPKHFHCLVFTVPTYFVLSCWFLFISFVFGVFQKYIFSSHFTLPPTYLFCRVIFLWTTVYMVGLPSVIRPVSAGKYWIVIDIERFVKFSA